MQCWTTWSSSSLKPVMLQLWINHIKPIWVIDPAILDSCHSSLVAASVAKPHTSRMMGSTVKKSLSGMAKWVRWACRLVSDRHDFRRNVVFNLGLFAAGVWVAPLMRHCCAIDNHHTGGPESMMKPVHYVWSVIGLPSYLLVWSDQKL